MDTILIKALQLILSFSLLVFIHEMGHFAFARLFKVRVEKFYLFFNPWFSLFKFKPKGSETEYGLGWLPLGGYVKIAGMIDESMDKEQMAKPAETWEFRSKPAWQRLIIIVAGVVMNVILSLAIYSMTLYAWGDKYVPVQNASLGMEFSQAAQSVGFVDGDILLSADGTTIDRFNDTAIRQIVESKEVKVLRNGVEHTVAIPESFMQDILKGKQGFAAIRVPMVVGSVASGYGAEKAGMQAGDSIVSIANQSTITYFDAVEVLSHNKSQEVEVGFYRSGMLMSNTVAVDENGKIGISNKPISEIFKVKNVEYTLLSSIPAGISKGIGKLTGYVTDMKYIFTKEGAQSVGGFGTIAGIFSPTWNWAHFWDITAFLSIALAFMNILPIPALDGGHALFLCYEIITGRQPNEKFMEYAQMAGMILLFGLMIYANGMDIVRLFVK
ncbi:MAG: RIP metalloprotease RseP [Bacteroidales bacterium]